MREQSHHAMAQGEAGKKADLEIKKTSVKYLSMKYQPHPVKRGLSISPGNPSHALPHQQAGSLAFALLAQE